MTSPSQRYEITRTRYGIPHAVPIRTEPPIESPASVIAKFSTAPADHVGAVTDGTPENTQAQFLGRVFSP